MVEAEKLDPTCLKKSQFIPQVNQAAYGLREIIYPKVLFYRNCSVDSTHEKHFLSINCAPFISLFNFFFLVNRLLNLVFQLFIIPLKLHDLNISLRFNKQESKRNQ